MGTQLDPPVFGWQPAGGSRWSPQRLPDGRARGEIRSPTSKSRASSTPASPSADSAVGIPSGQDSPKRKAGSLWRTAGRVAQLGAKFGKDGDEGRKVISEVGGSVRSYAPLDDTTKSASTSLPSLSRENMAFEPPPAYVKYVERAVGTPCSHR